MSEAEILAEAKFLPGGDFLIQGIEDIKNSRATISAYLILIGSPRIQLYGIEIPKNKDFTGSPEHKLYEILENENPAHAHSQYNSLIRKLVSLERALALLTKNSKPHYHRT